MLRKITDWILDRLPKDLRDDILAVKRYHFGTAQKPSTRELIMLVDGKNFHGGLCDRFKGIVSCYLFCLHNQLPFKLDYSYPFDLTEFLQPNEYDWRISAKEKAVNYRDVTYRNLIGEPTAARLTRLRTHKQIQCYANKDWVDYLNNFYPNHQLSWGHLFHQLFMPMPALKSEIEKHIDLIGGNYICAAFRFQHLLGDFPEYDYQPLPPDEQKILIALCKQALLQLQSESHTKILVTSDSNCFLEAVSGLGNIFTFPGKVVHVDCIAGASYETYMKSFVDFYLLAASQHIYSIGTDAMYKTEFPLYAAKLNNIPFERILI